LRWYHFAHHRRKTCLQWWAIYVYRGYTNLEKGVSSYFGENDTVMVKFSAIDDDAYEFWRNLFCHCRCHCRICFSSLPFADGYLDGMVITVRTTGFARRTYTARFWSEGLCLAAILQ